MNSIWSYLLIVYTLLICGKRLNPCQNIWDLWWVSPNNSSIWLYSHFICEPHTYQCLILSRQAQWRLCTIWGKERYSLVHKQPHILYQYKILLSFPSSRVSSNSMLINQFSSPSPPRKILFSQYTFRRGILRNHQKYYPCSLLLPFSSQSPLISGWNRSLKGYLAIYSVIWLDQSITAAHMDESTGF